MVTGALVVIGLWAVVATAAAFVLGRAVVIAEHRERGLRGPSTPPSSSSLTPSPVERPPLEGPPLAS